MILYGSSFSPYVRKVLAFAAERGVALDVRPIARGDVDPGFRAASPLGKMPALVDGDFALPDSTAIVTYLDAVAEGPRLIPDSPRERAMAYRWDEYADTELFGAARPIFFNRVVLPLFERAPGDAAAADAAEVDELPALIAHLEARVPDPGGWLIGDAITLADISVASPFVNLAHGAATAWREAAPRTAAWVATILARPSFAAMVDGETRLIAKLRARAQAA